ncbi:hypothetical protein AB9K41_00825 [Cribrihabitans sp. XS_ASV171]
MFGKKKTANDKSKSGYEKSGTPGKHGRGFGKGSAATNPDKHSPRTEAQKNRQDRELDRWKG